MKKITHFLLPLLLLGICLPTIFPMLQSGFFEMHDDTQVSRIFVMSKALTDGMFPVRFVEDLGYGYGYAIFNFYAPLPYYIGGAIAALLQNALFATKIVFILAITLAGLSMYYALRRFFGEIPSVVAAILYVYFPYHAVNTYVRGNMSELWAYVFIPFVFSSFFTLYYAKNKTLRKVFPAVSVFAVSLAALITSHNLSAYMALLFIGIFTIPALVITQKKVLLLRNILIGLLLACLLSAFYFLPVVFESQFTDVSSQIGGGSDFRDHFVCLNQFWKTNWGYTGSVPGCLDGMSFTLGKSTILLLPVLFLSFLYWYQKKKITQHFLLVSSLLGLVLSGMFMLPLSGFIWEILPGMEYLQFPWRFLNFFSLFFTFLLAQALFLSKKQLPKSIFFGICVVIIAVTITLYGRFFTPQQLFDRDNAFYTRRDYIGFEVSKRSDEYLPKGFVPLMSAAEIPTEKLQAEGVSVRELSSKTGLYEAVVTASEPAQVTAAIAYYPAWKLTIDGSHEPVVVEPRGFSFMVPQGEHYIKLSYEQTLIARIANSISLIGLFIIVVGIITKDTYGKAKTS